MSACKPNKKQQLAHSRVRLGPDEYHHEKVSVAKHRKQKRSSIEVWRRETREDQPRQEDGSGALARMIPTRIACPEPVLREESCVQRPAIALRQETSRGEANNQIMHVDMHTFIHTVHGIEAHNQSRMLYVRKDACKHSLSGGLVSIDQAISRSPWEEGRLVTVHP